MHQRQSAPQLPPPHPQLLLESLPPESDQSSVCSKSPYLSLPAPSALPSILASPLCTPSLAPAPPAPPAHPQHIRRPRSEWLPDQWAIPQHYRQIREPTPAIPSSDENDSNSDNPLTSSIRIQSLLSSPEHISNPSSTLMQICGVQHVRKRWKLTEWMVPGKLSNSLLESVQLAPDGS